MLTNLSLTNFKSWRSINGMRFSPITGLFGTNSSGKTSILQSLLMLRQTAESTDRSAVLEFGGERTPVNLGGFRDVIFGHNLQSPLGVSLTWNLTKPLSIADPNEAGKVLFSGDKIAFNAEVQSVAGGDKLYSKSLSYSLSDYKFVMAKKGTSGQKYELHAEGDGFGFKRTVGRVWDLPSPVKCYGFPDQTFAYFQNASFLSDLQLEFEKALSRVFYLGPLRDFPQRHYVWSGSEPADMGRRGERAIDAMLASRDRGRNISPGYKRKKQTLEERVAFWLQELGLISSFIVKPIAAGSNLYEVRVKKNPSSSEVLITDVGFGVSQILPVLVLCYYVPEGSTVLLEQPEIHLHPSVQAKLADVFVDVMKNRNVQIVIESHSEHLLRRLQRRIAEETLPVADCSLYFCSASGDASNITPLHLDLIGRITNWPSDFFGNELGDMAEIAKAAARLNTQKAKN